jgi:hypothetical protein
MRRALILMMLVSLLTFGAILSATHAQTSRADAVQSSSPYPGAIAAWTVPLQQGGRFTTHLDDNASTVVLPTQEALEGSGRAAYFDIGTVLAVAATQLRTVPRSNTAPSATSASEISAGSFVAPYAAEAVPLTVAARDLGISAPVVSQVPGKVTVQAPATSVQAPAKAVQAPATGTQPSSSTVVSGPSFPVAPPIAPSGTTTGPTGSSAGSGPSFPTGPSVPSSVTGGTSTSSAVSGPSFPTSPASPPSSPPPGGRSFSGGPCVTRCNDGTWSSSTGRGTCSSHGGEAR